MIKAEWTTTILEKMSLTIKFKDWFDTKFTKDFPELASNFEWHEEAHDEYRLENGSAEELSTQSLYLLFNAFNSIKPAKQYFQIPEVKDFYSGAVGTVEIDPGIINAIKELNRKGYNTVASCSGHKRFDGSFDEGYIWIHNFPTRKIPAGFYATTNDGKTSLRWSADSVEELENQWEVLEKWVNSLPTAVKTKASK